MGLNTRLTVGSVIMLIMLLSIFGVGRAFRYLTGNTPEDRPEDRIEDRIESTRVETFADDNDRQDRTRTASQSDTRIADARNFNEDGELELTPLQVAGTFIQRQKRIEEDPTVLGTEVAVLSVSNDVASDTPAPAAQSNTITSDQTYTPPRTGNTSTTSTRPANPEPATAPAVPALW